MSGPHRGWPEFQVAAFLHVGLMDGYADGDGLNLGPSHCSDRQDCLVCLEFFRQMEGGFS